MKRVAIVQARMSSSRFPGKVLELIQGVPMVVFMLRRISRSANIDQIVVATSREPSDDVLARVVVEAGYKCFRGDLNDVLSRFVAAANEASADIVVRLTADCPLIDSDIIDQCVSTLMAGSFDYVSNVEPPTFPHGLDVESFSIAALRLADSAANLATDREHVTPFIRRNKTQFRQQNIVSFLDCSQLRWTVDHPDDLELVRSLVSLARNSSGSVADRFDFMRAYDRHRSELPRNVHPRNENYQGSAASTVASSGKS